MELLGVVILSVVVICICVFVIKVSYIEAEAEHHAITLFFIDHNTTNPDTLLRQLSASYYGKIIIVNLDATPECCALCNLLCEQNSHLTYCEREAMCTTIEEEYSQRR